MVCCNGFKNCAVVFATSSNEVATGCCYNIKIQEGTVWPVKLTSNEVPVQTDLLSLKERAIVQMLGITILK